MSDLAHNNLLGERAQPSPLAEQQPDWQEHPAYDRTCRILTAAAPLTRYAEVTALRTALRAVAGGQARLLQVGDCAESLYECTVENTAEKLAVLTRLADRVSERTGDPVVTVGRIGGQFAKPRSQLTEQHGDRVLPSFRGHLVNSEVPTLAARRHDPRRMLWVYEASKKVLDWVSAYRTIAGDAALGPWASHEALVVD